MKTNQISVFRNTCYQKISYHQVTNLTTVTKLFLNVKRKHISTIINIIM